MENCHKPRLQSRDGKRSCEDSACLPLPVHQQQRALPVRGPGSPRKSTLQHRAGRGSVPKSWVHLTLFSADQEGMPTLTSHGGQCWPQRPSLEVAPAFLLRSQLRHEPKRRYSRLTPLAPRSSMGEFLWKTLSRPWEAVGTSCVLKLGGLLRGEDGLVSGPGASRGAGRD